MNFTKEQIDYIKHCGEHFEFLTGGRGHSKIKQIIEQLQQENARLKDKIKDIEKILKSNHDIEHIYCALSQYLDLFDYELDLGDYLKEN